MLSESQFLPGTESIRPAQPHEQTEAQFHARPNVFVHGRYERPDAAHAGQLDLGLFAADSNTAFHAGTERAAHDRLAGEESGLGIPHEGHKAVFYHGEVDPKRMRNTAVPGRWEASQHALGPAAGDPGRIRDQDEEWKPSHHDKYYRNEYEDKGSTSVILSAYTAGTRKGRDGYDEPRYLPRNFTTHREAISTALAQGQHVPSHVRAVYEATGGESGPLSVVHTHFSTPAKTKYETTDHMFPGSVAWTLGQIRAQAQKPPF